MTRRRVLFAAVGVAALAAVWVLARVEHSPRFEVFEPHSQACATREQFEAVIRERHYPVETKTDPSGWVELQVPLDGTKWGKRLQLSFDRENDLRRATVIDRSGENEWVFQVRK